MKLKQLESEDNFYVTSYSAGVKSRTCGITPLYCNNSVQHKHAAVTNMHDIIQGWVYINASAVQISIVFERDTWNNCFEFERTAAFIQCFK